MYLVFGQIMLPVMIGMFLKLRTFDRGIEAHFVIGSFSGFSTDNLANRWRQTESKFSRPLEPANRGYGFVAAIKKSCPKSGFSVEEAPKTAWRKMTTYALTRHLRNASLQKFHPPSTTISRFLPKNFLNIGYPLE